MIPGHRRTARGSAVVATALMVLLAGCASMGIQTIDEEEFLGDRSNPVSIYRPGTNGRIVSPFDLRTIPIRRLMLVDIEDDPHLRTIELQVLPDGAGGEEAVVLLFGHDGKATVCAPPGSGLSPDRYRDMLGEVGFREARIEHRLELGPKGLNAFVKTQDVKGRTIEILVRENLRDGHATEILAPLGAMVKDPRAFPFVYLSGFHLVPQRGSEISIRIGGVARKPKKIPVPVNGSRVYLTRYATQPIIGMWNREFDGRLEPLRPGSSSHMDVDQTRLHLIQNGDHFEIARISASDGAHSLRLTFSPPFPDLVSLKDGSMVVGRFSAGVDQIGGVFAGEYQIQRDDSRIDLLFQPTKGWQPQPGELWLKSYRWSAQLRIDPSGEVLMVSEWTRLR